MGCFGSKTTTDDVYNKEHNTKRRFVMGVHLGRAPDGIEGNVQIGWVSNGLRKYFRFGTEGAKVEERENTKRIKDDNNVTEIP